MAYSDDKPGFPAIDSPPSYTASQGINTPPTDDEAPEVVEKKSGGSGEDASLLHPKHPEGSPDEIPPHLRRGWQSTARQKRWCKTVGYVVLALVSLCIAQGVRTVASGAGDVRGPSHYENDPNRFPPSGPSHDDPSDPASRRKVIDVVSGSIHGAYDLFDLLSLRVRSGSISATVNPRPASALDPSAPAVFSASSQSGSIRAEFPSVIDRLPDRDYHTSLDATSGRISGSYILGGRTSLKSVSGGIDVMLAVANASRTLQLFTETRSGSTDVLVRSDGASLRRLRSTHHANSGSVTVRYGKGWEGHIHAKSMNGGIHIEGPDIIIERDEKGWDGSRIVEARRGHGGASEMVVKVMSGNVRILLV
ncbi:MAG: hypothetical protein M1817_004777 [Caeruleum heppii]|nr:MAG: hypothetical protein M1817_004777 [Caeruleum heppii]